MRRLQSVIEMFCLWVGAWLHMSCFVDDMMLLRSRHSLCGVYTISSRPCTHLAQERGPPRVALRAFKLSSGWARTGCDLQVAARTALAKQRNPLSPSPFLSGIAGIIVTCHSEMADCLICPGDLPLCVSCPCRLVPPYIYHCCNSF